MNVWDNLLRCGEKFLKRLYGVDFRICIKSILANETRGLVVFHEGAHIVCERQLPYKAGSKAYASYTYLPRLFDPVLRLSQRLRSRIRDPGGMLAPTA